MATEVKATVQDDSDSKNKNKKSKNNTSTSFNKGPLALIKNEVEKMDDDDNDDYKYETAINQVENIMESNVQTKGMVKYQKAKIGALEEEMDVLIEKMKLLESENWELKQINKNIMKDTKKEKVSSNTLNSKVEKLKEQQTGTQDKYESMLKINEDLKKDLETVNKQLKLREKDLANRDARLNKAVEETERLKNSLKTVREQTKYNDMTKEVEDLKTMNKMLEKQRDEVYEAFKKSLRLVDLYKKQNVHLEYATLLNVNEKEFMRLMEHKIN